MEMRDRPETVKEPFLTLISPCHYEGGIQEL